MYAVEEIAELRQQLATLRVEIQELRQIAIGRAARVDSSPENHSGVDTKTRFQGVYARHLVDCPKALDRRLHCHCKPSY